LGFAHLAWASVEARHRLMEGIAANVAAFVDGSPIHVVNFSGPVAAP
jgi:glycerate dehydrogenase